MWIQSLGQEDSLEEGMATLSSILPWRIPWTEDPGRLQSKRSQRVAFLFWSKSEQARFQNLFFFLFSLKSLVLV